MNSTAGSAIQFCQETTIQYTTGTNVTNNLTNCVYNTYVGYNAINLSVGANYSNIDVYIVSVGMIQNPSSARYVDSFQIYFSGGNPSGNVTQGLQLTYSPNLIYSATLTH